MYIHVHTYTDIYIYVFMYMYVFCTYYIYTHIRDSLVKSPQWEPSIPQQLNTNVIRGACETCTTSCKRGQLLWIRWQVLKHCKELSIRLYPYIYDCICIHTPSQGWASPFSSRCRVFLRCANTACCTRQHSTETSRCFDSCLKTTRLMWSSWPRRRSVMQCGDIDGSRHNTLW